MRARVLYGVFLDTTAIVLALTGLVYLGNGFYHLTLAADGADDLRRRRQEQLYVARGKDPFKVGFESERIRSGWEASPDPSHHPDPDIGPLSPPGYPPWAFTTAEVVVLRRPWSLTRLYFAFLNALALAYIAAWAYRLGAPHGPSVARLMASASLALSANAVCLRLGQYAVLITALLLAMAGFDRRNKPVLAGLTLALALTKPQLTAPFVLLFLARRRFLLLAAAASYLTVASLVTWFRTGEDPASMILEMIPSMMTWGNYELGLLHPLIGLGLSPTLVTLIGLGLGAYAAFWIFLRGPARGGLASLGVGATIGQLWTYHRRYDHVTMVLLLLPLADTAFTVKRRWTTLTCALVALTLFLPIREKDWSGFVPTMVYCLWIAGLTVLWRSASSTAHARSTPGEEPGVRCAREPGLALGEQP